MRSSIFRFINHSLMKRWPETPVGGSRRAECLNPPAAPKNQIFYGSGSCPWSFRLIPGRDPKHAGNQFLDMTIGSTQKRTATFTSRVAHAADSGQCIPPKTPPLRNLRQTRLLLAIRAMQTPPPPQWQAQGPKPNTAPCRKWSQK